MAEPTSSLASHLQAYKRAALKYHPDKASADERGEAEKKFKQVNAANTILSDPAKRQRYDAGVCRFPPDMLSSMCMTCSAKHALLPAWLSVSRGMRRRRPA